MFSYKKLYQFWKKISFNVVLWCPKRNAISIVLDNGIGKYSESLFATRMTQMINTHCIIRQKNNDTFKLSFTWQITSIFIYNFFVRQFSIHGLIQHLIRYILTQKWQNILFMYPSFFTCAVLIVEHCIFREVLLLMYIYIKMPCNCHHIYFTWVTCRAAYNRTRCLSLYWSLFHIRPLDMLLS